MIILKDTREQQPLRFSHPYITSTKKVKLHEGDYGCILKDGYEVPVYFERKAFGDLFSTLTGGHIRFRKELNRAKDKGNEIIIIIEGTFDEVLAGYTFSKTKGESIIATLKTLEVKYDIHSVFCASRAEMSRYIIYHYVAWGKMYMKNKGVIVPHRAS